MPQAGPLLEALIELPKLLHTGLNDRPNDAALVSMEGVWSWADLEQASARIAAQYLGLGLKPGDRVASLMPNRTALFIHYLACFKAGLVTTPLNYRYTPPEIDHALEVSRASLIFAHAERAADIAASKASSLPLGVVTYGGEEDQGQSFEALLKAPRPTSPCRNAVRRRLPRSFSLRARPVRPRA